MGGVATGRLTPFVENWIVPAERLAKRFPTLYDVLGGWTEKYRWYANWVYQCWFYDMDFVPFDVWQVDRQMAAQRSVSTSACHAYDSLFATDLTNFLDCVQARTLVLSGIQDGTVPVDQAHLLAERIKGAQLVLYDQCGHFPMFEKVDDYLATLNIFFAQKGNA